MAYTKPTVTRQERVEVLPKHIFAQLDNHQRESVDFVLAQYVYLGIDELGKERVPQLISIKYHSQMEGSATLGGTEKARGTFVGFQRYLYGESAELGKEGCAPTSRQWALRSASKRIAAATGAGWQGFRPISHESPRTPREAGMI